LCPKVQPGTTGRLHKKGIHNISLPRWRHIYTVIYQWVLLNLGKPHTSTQRSEIRKAMGYCIHNIVTLSVRSHPEVVCNLLFSVHTYIHTYLISKIPKFIRQYKQRKVWMPRIFLSTENWYIHTYFYYITKLTDISKV